MLIFHLAAAAARINASIQAKKGIQHVDVPPIRAVSYCSPCRFPHSLTKSQTESPVAKASSPNPNAGSSTSNINGDMYIADGDYIKDIEVNDLRNRYTLTKGSTQKMVIILVISTDTPRCRVFKSHVTFKRFYVPIHYLVWETARSLQWLI